MNNPQSEIRNPKSFDRQIEAAFRRLEDLERQVKEATGVLPEQRQQTLRMELLEELSIALEELQVAGEELQQQNEALAAAQQALETERQRYRELFELAPDGYLVTDAEGVIQEANHAATALLNRDQKFLRGKPLVLFVADEDRQVFHTTVSRLQKSGGAARLEGWELQIRPDAHSSFYAALTISAVRNAEGRLTGLRWLLRDISVRKQAEEALHRSALRLQMLRELDEATLAARPLAEIAQSALDYMGWLVPCYQASVVVFDLEAEEATILVTHPPAETGLEQGARLPLTMDETLEELRSGQVRLVEDIQALPQPDPLARALPAEGVRAYLSIPLVAQDELFGVLSLGLDRPGTWAPEHVLIAREVADQLGVAIWQAHLREQVQRYTEELEQRVAKRTAELLQERNFASAILDTIGALIVVTDTQGRIVRFNGACERVTGYTFDEVRGKLIWELFLPPEEIEPVKAVFKQLCDGQFPNQFENHWITKDGKCRLIAWSNTVLLDPEGSVEYIIGTGIDLTERKQAEEALAGERNLLRTLIDNLPDYVYIKDTASRFIMGNVAVARIMGAKSPDELAGKTDFEFFPYEVAAQYYADEQKVIRTGQPLINKEEFATDPAGNSRWVLTTKAPLRDKRGQTVGIVGIGRNISERKQMEEEKDRLLEEVSRQRAELRVLASRLAEAEETERKQLARELHDQVGQNLTALGFNLNIIWAQLAGTAAGVGPIQNRLDDSLALVEETAERIRDVMASLHPPVLDDYGLVAALNWYGARFASWTGLSVTVQGQEPDPRLAAPVESALFRIAQEALTNAAKHSQATQVTVTVEVINRTVRLAIADDGIGFEPARPIEFAGRQSWGLLSMTERAEAVGGRCRIESRPGQGTQVSVEVSR